MIKIIVGVLGVGIIYLSSIDVYAMQKGGATMWVASAEERQLAEPELATACLFGGLLLAISNGITKKPIDENVDALCFDWVDATFTEKLKWAAGAYND